MENALVECASVHIWSELYQVKIQFIPKSIFNVRVFFHSFKWRNFSWWEKRQMDKKMIWYKTLLANLANNKNHASIKDTLYITIKN